MPAKAIIGAVTGALVGAIVWAVISFQTGYEIGWIAWGIGLLVGYGAHYFEGSGKAMGITCAALALFAIFFGKWLTIDVALGAEIDAILEAEFDASGHQQMLADAAAFADLPNEDAYPAFMVAHQFTAAARPEEITADELAWFRAEQAPAILDVHNNPPTLDEWRDGARAGMTASVSKLDVLRDGLHPLDFLFAFLGISTAYRLGRGKDEEVPA